MINRNNKYVEVDKKKLNDIISGIKGKALVAVVGTLVTVSLLSGCGKGFQVQQSVPTIDTNSTTIEILYTDVDDINLSDFNVESDTIRIVGTDLTDISELANYQNIKWAYLSDNLITDVSELSALTELRYLDVSNNSISYINLEEFSNLDQIRVEGNYNLYTEDLINYCEQNAISLDITREDVQNVNRLREIIKTLNLDGLSDLEKERVIYQYVLDNMEYDKKALRDDELTAEYNINDLAFALEGKGVCVNYATLFDAMCELSGINCYSVSGLGNGGPHRWNLVEIDGEYMLCDPTWSDGLSYTEAMTFIYDKTGYNLDKYYNITGEDATDFIESHVEGRPTYYGSNDVLVTNAKSSEVLESNIENISEETLGDKILSKINEVVDSIDLSKVDIKELTSKILLGIAGGSVVLLSRNLKKSLKKKISEYKKQQKLKKKTKRNEEKRTTDIKTIDTGYIYVDSSDVEEDKKSVESEIKEEIIMPIHEKEPTEQEILASLRTDEERIEYLNNKAQAFLRKAAEIQIDMEIFNNLVKSIYRDDEDKIQEAMIELLNLLSKDDNEKALIRCQKFGYLSGCVSLDNLSSLEQKALEATKRMYSEVDQIMNEYLRIQKLSSDVRIQNLTPEQIVELMANGVDVLNEGNNQLIPSSSVKKGFAKVGLLTILTLVISIGIIVLGVILG